jgi:hypothetical protein
MDPQKQLVGVEACLASIFPDKNSRPGLRSFRRWQADGFIPYYKIGRRTFFDPVEVRAEVDRRFKIKAIDR